MWDMGFTSLRLDLAGHLVGIWPGGVHVLLSG